MWEADRLMPATPDTIETSRSGSVTAIVCYAAFAVVAILATTPTAWHMAQTWVGSSSYHHGLFVAPAAIWMIATRAGWPPEDSGTSRGLAITALGLMIWLVGFAGSAAIVSQAGLVTILIGGAGVLFSDRALTHWAYPLAFLYFMIPFGESIVPALQLGTAKAVVGLLSVFGFDVSIEGVLIHTDVGSFAIAEACAGLRLLIAALMISAIFAYAAFTSWSKRIAFLLFAAAFAIFANAIRAFVLVLIPLISGGDAHVGPDHFIIGWVLYLTVLVILMLIGRRFADQRTSYKQHTISPPLQVGPMIIASILIVSAAAYAHLVINRDINRPLPASIDLISVPGWQLLPPPENWSAQFPGADRTGAATYQKDNQRVYVALSEFAYDRRDAEIASRANRAWDGMDWDRAGTYSEVIYLFGSSKERSFDVIAGPANRRLLSLSAYWLDNKIYFNRRNVKLKQAMLKLQGRNPAGGVIILAASFRKDPEEALAILRQYTSDTESFSEWREPSRGD